MMAFLALETGGSELSVDAGGTDLEVQAHQQGEDLRVAIRGRITWEEASALREALCDWVARQRPRTLLLDLEQVTGLDAAGVGILAVVRNVLAEQGGAMRLCNGRASIREAVEKGCRLYPFILSPEAPDAPDLPGGA